MTKEEMINLNKLYKFNYDVAYEIEGDFDQIKRLAIIATIVEILRKDLKSIVADAVKEAVQTAVKEAVGTLTSDRKPVCPGDTALNDFLKLHLLNYKPNDMFPIDETGKHPIAANTYKGQYRFRAKLSVMGIAYFEEIQGYLTDSPIGEPYKLLVNGKWMECPTNFTDYDFAGLSKDMNTLKLDFICAEKGDIEKCTEKSCPDAQGKQVKIEDGKHTIENSYFKFRSTRQFLNSYGVKYLEDIKGYTNGNLNIGIVPMIRIGDNHFSEPMPIPFDNFEDLKESMDSFGIQFEEIK